MNSDKIITLLTKLQQRTESGDVTWEKTAEENQFQTTLGKYTIRLLEFPSAEPETYDYFLRLHDEGGALIDSLSDVELHQISPGVGAYKMMGTIFRSARRSATGVDKAIDSIIQGLDEIMPF